MPDEKSLSPHDPRFHTQNLKRMLTELIDHARSDVQKISDPKAQALFETTAEVLTGLHKALDDFEMRNEPAWKQAS
jgi:hypothetical protein